VIEKCKESLFLAIPHVFWALFLVLVSAISFGLGHLSGIERTRDPIVIRQAPPAAEPEALYIGGLVVASKTGKKYHFPWCPGAETMKASNRMWFDSIEDAQKAGYAPAGNCPGLH
jgi:hypothetical protein